MRDYSKIKSDKLTNYGEHNILINNMYNSAYDTPEDVLKDAQDYDLEPWQQEKLMDEIVGVFGFHSRNELNDYLKGIK